ncbi:peptidase E [Dulcicalothrix desertica PCC 7102]|uniref:dipeptidase E n=1 Tax=Dulcicalothrix desertica PCC 7102 TaxID=232991 RepID=A0A433VJ95_9CYAN|nr:dipeptidase PepE [Dulcicalothrix desertica]RUT06140.1 peptidase E [Dulcicalothrix desertica PCC 7102]TWH54200.1 dipeptidase E [Dulcicalothrix desertica PCC 7102]
MNKRLLLLSNSTNYGEEYLSYPRQEIKAFLGASIKKVLFIPFANVISYDGITEKVGKVFQELGYGIDSVHSTLNPRALVENAEAIVVSGGNTFHLVHRLHEAGIIDIIREKVNNGTPYIGWSAGSNVACPTIKTTNDMPIIEPMSFEGLNLVPFQINPHYTDGVVPDHNGETRESRIEEFLAVNPNITVVGLPEGTILKIENSSVKLIGDKNIVVFKSGEARKEYGKGADLNILL